MDYTLNEDFIKHITNKVKSLVLPSEDNNYRSRFLQSNILLYCVVLLLILKIGVILISVNIPQNIFFADITRSSLENFVNQTRQSFGIKPLAENAKLNQAAQMKAENMVQNQYFNHTSPSGVTPWFWFSKSGYNYKYAGENLAVGFFDSQEVFNAWLNSPSHKANIVNPNYTEVGTAVMSGFGNNNSIIVVQEFGSPNIKNSLNVNTKKVTIEKPVIASEPKVLSQSTESKSTLEALKIGSSGVYYKVANTIVYDNDRLLQDITYGISLTIIGVLLMLIFFNFKVNFKRQLVFRAILIMVLLSAATLVNREVVIAFIPHQIII